MKQDRKNIINRLAFIKYLYTFAVEQSYRPEPFCAISVLIFHDAIELFNQLTLESKGDDEEIKIKIKKLGKKEIDLNFMDYWEILELNQKAAFYRFNKARVALKHHGIRLSKLDIESFRVIVTSFLEENTSNYFEINFSKISLIDLVNFEPARISLKEAAKFLEEDSLKEALDNVAVGFSQLIRDYEKKKSIFGQSPFSFAESLSFSDNIICGIGGKKVIELSKFIRKITKSIESIEDTLKIIALGIDFRKYVKFRLVTPHVSWSIGGKYFLNYGFQVSKAVTSVNDVEYCINFVIESAIILQNVDFELEREGYISRIKIEQ